MLDIIRERVAEVGARIWHLCIQLLLLALTIMAIITVPWLLPGIREAVAARPTWYATWAQALWWGWLGTAWFGLSLWLWANRTRWAPSLARHVARGVQWLCNRSSRRQERPAQPSAQPASAPLPEMPTPKASNRQLPPLDLLGPLVPIEVKACPEEAQTVVNALASLGVPGCKVVSSFAGPALKSIQIRTEKPASHVRKLGEDLAASLGVKAVSINPVVGAPGVLQVDLTADRVVSVPLRTLVDSPAFRDGGVLPIALGANVRGQPLVIDLTATPHLLIAGATNSGKSGVMREVVTCLVMCHRPDELGLLLIDPKRVEFSFWAGLPHLLRPIITTAQDAQRALQSLVQEMHRRYEALQAAGVTKIQEYNEKHPGKKMPYIVTVIDEMAQLMETDREIKEATESAIKQLGQLARAAGIHLVLATQTPRATIITGEIKANVPSQVGLRCNSNLESRIILDEVGCERLRGRGDLLFRSSEADQLVRAQASWVPTEVVQSLVQWWAQPGKAAAVRQPEPAKAPTTAPEQVVPPVTATVTAPATPPAAPVAPPATIPKSELDQVKELALEQGCLSRRMVARALGVGNSRAQELVQKLDSIGWLRPARGPQPRQITLGPVERRQMLSHLRRCRPEDVVLADPATISDADNDDETASAALAPVEGGAQIDLHAEADRLDRLAKVAHAAGDRNQMKSLVEELGRLVDLALDRQDPPSFHRLAAIRRWLQETVQTDRRT